MSTGSSDTIHYLRRQQQVPALQGCNHLSMESPLHATCPRHLVEDLGVGDELWEEFVDATCPAANNPSTSTFI